MALVQVNLRLSEADLAVVDAVRGDVPRNRWLRGVVRDACGALGVFEQEQAVAAAAVVGGHSPSVPAEVPVGVARAEAFRRAAGGGS